MYGFFFVNYLIYSIMLGKRKCQSKIYIKYMLNDMVGASKGSETCDVVPKTCESAIVTALHDGEGTK